MKVLLDENLPHEFRLLLMPMHIDDLRPLVPELLSILSSLKSRSFVRIG